MTRNELDNLPQGARVRVKSGKTYQRTNEPEIIKESPWVLPQCWGQLMTPYFVQLRDGERFGPSKTLKPENCERIG